MESEVRYATTNDYKVIPSGNLKLSKKFYAKGTSQILLNSMNVVEDEVILRGDLGKITIGNATILDYGCILRPGLSSSSPPFEYKHVKIGNNCYVGKNSIISAIVVGNNTYIGDNCIIV